MEAFFAPFIRLVLRYSYAAEFLLLLACGLGLPIPEEVTLISGGYLCWATRGHAHPNRLWVTVAVCMTAILLGDWLMFMLGRRYGKWVLRHRWFRRLLARRKLARVTLYYRRYGAKTVFFARFFAGLRVPVYFLAGTHKMRSWKFLWLDFWGAFLSVPISVWAGKYFGADIKHAIKVMTHAKTEVMIGILVCVALYALYRWWRRRREAARHAEKVCLDRVPDPR